jgi:hypothetical protein
MAKKNIKETIPPMSLRAFQKFSGVEVTSISVLPKRIYTPASSLSSFLKRVEVKGEIFKSVVYSGFTSNRLSVFLNTTGMREI